MYGMGMVLHKMLDKALSSRHKWIKFIEGFAKKTEIVKNLSQNFYIKKVCVLDLQVMYWVGNSTI